MSRYSRRFKSEDLKVESLADAIALIGLGLGLIVFALILTGAILLIPAWIIHWGLVNLFSYTALSFWQVWGIIVAIRMVFGGLVQVNNK